MAESERVVSAAVQYDGLIFSLPKPARHAHIVRAMHLLGMLKDVTSADMCRKQGFLTNLGRYVNRQEACEIAREAGQLEHCTKTGPDHALYSEDLW